MTPWSFPSSAAARGVLAASLLALAGPALAQYKIVGPDGSVTYTDKPPAVSAQRAPGASPDSGGGGLPYETRQAMSRYPVMLYAQKGCSPCDQARQWLKEHGIPFGEYSIETSADIEQFKQRFNGVTMPVITLGSQVIKGYTPSELASYTDAAGYPKQASLRGYNWPSPVPLAPPQPARAAAPSAQPSSAGPRIDLPPPSTNGIQF